MGVEPSLRTRQRSLNPNVSQSRLRVEDLKDDEGDADEGPSIEQFVTNKLGRLLAEELSLFCSELIMCKGVRE